MAFVTLEEAKAQCAVDEDVEIHDARLERLILSAEAWAANFINQPLADTQDSPPAGLPEDLKSAILLHIEFEFDPDAQKDFTIRSCERLAWPYRVNVGI